MANKEPSQANPRLSLHIAQEGSFDSLRSLRTRILIGCSVRGSIKCTPATEPGESAPAVTTGKGRRERSKPCKSLVPVADLVNHNRHWGTPPPGVLWKDIILLGLARTASEGCDFIGVRPKTAEVLGQKAKTCDAGMRKAGKECTPPVNDGKCVEAADSTWFAGDPDGQKSEKSL